MKGQWLNYCFICCGVAIERLKIMKTPKLYAENLKNRIITQDMLCDCLFSVNKRAKNCRDKIREYKSYRYFEHKWDDIKVYEDKRDSYYKMKNQLLTVLNPICIHKVTHYDFYTDGIRSIEYFLFYEIAY